MDKNWLEHSRRCPYCTGLFSNVPSEQRASWDIPVLEGIDAAVVPTRGSLIEGWILVVPREHVLSSAALPETRKTAIWETVAESLELVKAAYGTATVFEHGAAVPSSVIGCGIDHVHFHVAPTQFDLSAAARNYSRSLDLNWVFEERWPTDPARPFLAVSDGEGVWRAEGQIPSQFFRRVIAAELGRESEFDWKTNDGLAYVEKTSLTLSATSSEASFAG